jgi:hypothetical protein
MRLRTSTAKQPASDAAMDALDALLVIFALYHLGLAAFMAISPHAFYRAIGPFEALNRHYIRDVASFSAALGVGFAVALKRPSWRVPVIAVTTVQFALHTINHLADATGAHPEWKGWFDFASLLASTALLAWMWRTASRPARAHRAQASPAPATAPLPAGGTPGPGPLNRPPVTERSST